EDEPRMAALLRRGFEEEGYAVDVALNGVDAEWLASEHDYDAVVLDVMLPGRDGFEVCRRLREDGRWMPILMLTARDAVADRAPAPRAGPRPRRGRLPGKPFTFRRAGPPPALAGPAPPPRAVAARPGRRPEARPGPPAGVARRHGAQPVAQGIRRPRTAHAPPG